MASKRAKEKRKKARDAAKAARKRANYLRYGPKEGHAGRRQKKAARKLFRPSKQSRGPIELDQPTASGRRRARRLQRAKSKLQRAKLPLVPLRQRRHYNTVQIHDRRMYCV